MCGYLDWQWQWVVEACVKNCALMDCEWPVSGLISVSRPQLIRYRNQIFMIHIFDLVFTSHAPQMQPSHLSVLGSSIWWGTFTHTAPVQIFTPLLYPNTQFMSQYGHHCLLLSFNTYALLPQLLSQAAMGELQSTAISRQSAIFHCKSTARLLLLNLQPHISRVPGGWPL